MAKKSVESEMFQEMTDTIEDGIAFGVPTLTSKALAKGLIDLRAQNKIRTGSEFEQAEKFVAAIAAKLRGDPSVLHKFIDILREEPCYDDLVQRIEDTLSLKKSKEAEPDFDLPEPNLEQKQKQKQRVKN